MATVLLVEDNDDLREMMTLALELAGQDVVSARNGREALGLLRGRPIPCLILLDLMMPVMDGWTFRATLERDEQLARIPVVVVSAVDPEASERLHASAVLPKPVDIDQLVQVVCRHCSRPASQPHGNSTAGVSGSDEYAGGRHPSAPATEGEAMPAGGRRAAHPGR